MHKKRTKEVSKREVAFRNVTLWDFRASRHLLNLYCTRKAVASWIILNFKSKIKSDFTSSTEVHCLPAATSIWKWTNTYATFSVGSLTAGTHPRPLPGQRPSDCRRLFYPRWRCMRGRGRQGRTSGTDGPWRPPSGGPSSDQRGDGPGSGAPWGWACSQLPWSSGRPGWGRCLVWPLAREEPVI